MSKLKKINKQSILDSSLWKPPDKSIDIVRNTNSWFNLDQMNYDGEHKIRFANTKTIRSYPIRIFPSIVQKHILLTCN